MRSQISPDAHRCDLNPPSQSTRHVRSPVRVETSAQAVPSGQGEVPPSCCSQDSPTRLWACELVQPSLATTTAIASNSLHASRLMGCIHLSRRPHPRCARSPSTPSPAAAGEGTRRSPYSEGEGRGEPPPYLRNGELDGPGGVDRTRVEVRGRGGVRGRGEVSGLAETSVRGSERVLKICRLKPGDGNS